MKCECHNKEYEDIKTTSGKTIHNCPECYLVALGKAVDKMVQNMEDDIINGTYDMIPKGFLCQPN